MSNQNKNDNRKSNSGKQGENTNNENKSKESKENKNIKSWFIKIIKFGLCKIILQSLNFLAVV